MTGISCSGFRIQIVRRAVGESGQSDRIPRTEALCGHCGHAMHWRECGSDADMTAPCQCRNDVASSDPRGSGQSDRIPTFDPPAFYTTDELAAYHKGYTDGEASVAPPEPPLNVERLAAALENLDPAMVAYFCRDDWKGTPRKVATDLAKLYGGAAPDRLPSVEALHRAICESVWVDRGEVDTLHRHYPEGEWPCRDIAARLASLHEGTARPDGGGEGDE